MNSRTRHLVLNPLNQPQRPCDHGLNLKGIQSDKSPSFLDLETAKQFAALLAEKDKGNAYYVATVVGGTEAFDDLAARQAGKGVTVTWVDAKPE